MHAQVTQLRVGDEGFLVTSMIDRCPKSMMLRELVRNAIEAAQTVPGTSPDTGPGNQRRVELSGILVNGVRKLAIWNGGRGMTADELHRMCDIASSIRKQNSLEQNFGMGAKVASLPSNRHGMRYRSCHQGRVHEVQIGQRNGVYGRLRRSVDGVEGWHDMQDATAQARADGRSLAADWTEVVLLGNRAGQDTLADPYDGAPAMPAYWVAEELTKKFFRLPDGIEVLLQPGATTAPGCFRFRAIAERFGSGPGHDYSRAKSVAVGDGIVVHYLFDDFLPSSTTVTCAGNGMPYFVHGAGGLVFRDEIYDLAWNQDWLYAGPVFGIPFAGRNISVYVELPDDFPVLPDGYRQFLRHRGGLQQQVSLRDYAGLVAANRPGWLVALIQARAPGSAASPEIAATLAQLLRDLGVPRRSRAATRRAADVSPPPDAEAVQLDAGEAADPAVAAPDAGQPDGHKEIEPEGADFESAPQIVMLRDEVEVSARGLRERAARYYPETHQLFVNCLYAAVAAMQSVLEREFGWMADQDTLRERAQHQAEQSMVERVGRMLVFGLAKQPSWAGWEMDHALSSQALTLAADDHYGSLPVSREVLRAIFRQSRYDVTQKPRGSL